MTKPGEGPGFGVEKTGKSKRQAGGDPRAASFGGYGIGRVPAGLLAGSLVAVIADQEFR
jgi:hypothetical protein